MNFSNFFSNNNDSQEDLTGAAAPINEESLTNADFAEDDDFFIDIESWGERIALK